MDAGPIWAPATFGASGSVALGVALGVLRWLLPVSAFASTVVSAWRPGPELSMHPDGADFLRMRTCAINLRKTRENQGHHGILFVKPGIVTQCQPDGSSHVHTLNTSYS